jgi:ubiquinone/menaquinone biosynthesis C-methylase UbiE
MTTDTYVLRARDQEEITRLKLQHEVWKEKTDAAVSRAQFSSGDRLLDLGCGPGALSLDLADITGSDGSVLALDKSEQFIQHLREQAPLLGRPWIDARVGDVVDFPYGENTLDGAVCRWMLMFLMEPEKVIEKLALALRPGARIVVMEYVQFRSMSLWPTGDAFKKLYHAVHELIGRFGGNADIGGRVPDILTAHGFEVLEMMPMLRIGRPGSALWDWLDATHKNHPNLVEAGLISQTDMDAYVNEWAEASRDPSAFFTTPPVLATIARKI